MMDLFMQAAIEEAEAGRHEGGIPIGSVLVYQGKIIGRGHNRRVQRGSAILHGEMDALENAGRQAASVYAQSTLYVISLRHVFRRHLAVSHTARGYRRA